MNLKTIGKKLVGNDEERAVSPVIGVILMVAITVILAAVIAAFVLDLGDDMGSGSVDAAVTEDVSNSNGEIKFSLTESGDEEEFVLRGSGVDTDEVELNVENTGDSVTLGETDDLMPSGSANIVAIDGDAESTIGSVEWDFDPTVSVEEDGSELVLTLVATGGEDEGDFELRGSDLDTDPTSLGFSEVGDEYRLSSSDVDDDPGSATIVVDGDSVIEIGSIEWDFS